MARRSRTNRNAREFCRHVSISRRDECLPGFIAFPMCVVKPGGRRQSGRDESEFEVRRSLAQARLFRPGTRLSRNFARRNLRQAAVFARCSTWSKAASISKTRRTRPDPDRQNVQFDRAKAKFEEFAKQHATHPRASEALVRLATDRESGRLAAVNKKLTEARTAFDQSRKAYDKAIEQRSKAYEMYRGRFFEKTDPRSTRSRTKPTRP